MSALEGLRILDLSRLLPGSFCTQLLGDLGADVIKVESPGEGDGARVFPPLQGGIGSVFLLINRNKRSITLNLKSAEGRELFLRLAEKADVVFETFRPGVMDRLKLGYEVLREVNPRIICASLSGFGQSGPYRDQPGHDLNYLALAGVLGLNGPAEGQPVPPAVQIADLGGGSQAALVILAAVIARQRTGRGQYIDLSLFGSAVSWLPTLVCDVFAEGRSPVRGEPVLAGGYPHYAVYATGDGRHLALGALETKFLTAFLDRLGRLDLMPLATGTPEQRAQFRATVQEILGQRSLAEWMELFEGVDTCLAPVNTLSEALRDPQVQHYGLLSFVDHPQLGRIPQIGIPFVLSDTPGTIRRPAPGLGEHNAEILAEVGADSARLSDLVARGVV